LSAEDRNVVINIAILKYFSSYLVHTEGIYKEEREVLLCKDDDDPYHAVGRNNLNGT